MNFILPAIALIIIVSCNNNSAEKTKSETSASNDNETASTRGGPLVGEWEKSFYAKDLNGNKQVEENEKESADKNYGVSDYFKFSSNGKCEYESIKFKGEWEVIEEKRGKTIYVYPLVDGVPSKGNPVRYPLFTDPSDKEFIIIISDRIVGYKKI